MNKPVTSSNFRVVLLAELQVQSERMRPLRPKPTLDQMVDLICWLQQQEWAHVFVVNDELWPLRIRPDTGLNPIYRQALLYFARCLNAFCTDDFEEKYVPSQLQALRHAGFPIKEERFRPNPKEEFPTLELTLREYKVFS